MAVVQQQESKSRATVDKCPVPLLQKRQGQRFEEMQKQVAEHKAAQAPAPVAGKLGKVRSACRPAGLLVGCYGRAAGVADAVHRLTGPVRESFL